VTESLYARFIAAPVTLPAEVEAAEAKLRELLEAVDFAPARDLAVRPAVRAVLLGVARHSPYLWSLISENPARAARLLLVPPETSLEALIGEIETNEPGEEAAVSQQLRRAKREAHLLVALADIGGVWDVDAATGALSRFADAAVSAALRFLLRAAARERRLALDPDAPDIELFQRHRSHRVLRRAVPGDS